MSIIRVRVWDRVRSVRITNENQAQFLTKELRHLNSFFFLLYLCSTASLHFFPPPNPPPFNVVFRCNILSYISQYCMGEGGGQLAGPILKKDNQIVSYYKFSN